ncbi:MAG: peptidoglycan DD-metalloendopeptidase family protein [Candidatus Igneacidithiobacillus chanchocoensis]
MNPRLSAFAALLAALFCLDAGSAVASDLPQKINASKARLANIHHSVSALQAQLQEKQKTQSQLRSEIQQLDGRIQSTQGKLQKIDGQRQQTHAEIAKLQQQIDHLQQTLQQQKQILADQLRAAYMLGGETPLAVWLQTEKPAEIGRLSTYYQSLARARLELISKTQSTTTQIAQTQHQKKQQEAQLTRLAQQTQAQENTLQAQRNQHANLEEQLVRRIAADQAKIANLEANANILNGLVNRLTAQYSQQLAAERAAAKRAAEAAARKRAEEQRLAAERRAAAQQAAARAAAERRAAARAAEKKRAEELQQQLHQAPLPSKPVTPAPIATVPVKPPPAEPAPLVSPPPSAAVGHGSFPPPVSAPVQHLFGTPRVAGGPAWQGVTFAAAAGTPVHAIAPGMVLYAGPLRGYSEIVIVQQADLVLAIYGHLAQPQVRVGQKVQTGSLLGSVANGGEMQNDGLYLEIRSHGNPVNPLHYLR